MLYEKIVYIEELKKSRRFERDRKKRATWRESFADER